MAEREEYIDKLESQLREWNEQIDNLQERAGQESQEMKKKISKRMDELKAKRSELKVKLNRIKDSGDETFSKLRGDAENLWKDVKKGVSDIRSILNQ